MSGKKSTNDLIKDLLASVATLQKDVTALKTNGQDQQKHKRPRDEGDVEQHDSEANHDGDEHNNRDSDPNGTESEGEPFIESNQFKVSKEGEAFLETVFSSRLEYATRKARWLSMASRNRNG